MRVATAAGLTMLLVLTGCKSRSGCAEFKVEISVPPGTAVNRIAFVTPGAMSSNGDPKVARVDAGQTVYEFTSLAFDNEKQRTIAVGIVRGETAVFPIPAGRQRQPAFSPWRKPSYVTSEPIPWWNILHGATPQKSAIPLPILMRFSFTDRACSD